MPAIRAPSVHHSLRSTINPMGFLAAFDDRVYPRDFASSVDGYYSTPDADYHHTDVSNAQWLGSTFSLSELEVYEQASQCPPPFIVNSTTEDIFNRFDDSFDGHPYPFSYDSASSTSSGSPYPLNPEFVTSMSAMSPSISVTSSSPRSEPGALSPPLQEYPSFFDFDNGSSSYMNDYAAGSWSTSHLSPLSSSSSPAPSHLDASEARSNASWDGSSSTGETEKVDRRRFPCLILGCNRRFTSQYTLKVHMEAHKPKPRVTFPCTEGCSERFSRQHDRLRHEVAKHGKVCEFLCDDCGRFFSTRKTLGNHKCPVAQGGTRWVTS